MYNINIETPKIVIIKQQILYKRLKIFLRYFILLVVKLFSSRLFVLYAKQIDFLVWT